MTANNKNIKDLGKLKNKGWQGMNQLLDSQMPVAAASSLVWWKTKLFIISGGIVLLGLGFFAGRISSPKNSSSSLATNSAEKTEAPASMDAFAKASNSEMPEAKHSNALTSNFTDNRVSTETAFNSKKTTISNLKEHPLDMVTHGKEPLTGQVSPTSKSSGTQASNNSSLEKEALASTPITSPSLHNNSVMPNSDSVISTVSRSTENNMLNTHKAAPKQIVTAGTKTSIDTGKKNGISIPTEPSIRTIAEQNVSDTGTLTIHGKGSFEVVKHESSEKTADTTNTDAADNLKSIKVAEQASPDDSTEINSPAVNDDLAANNDLKEEPSMSFEDIKPKNLYEEFKSEGYEIGATFGTSCVRGDDNNFAYNLYASKRLWGPIGLGVSHGIMELRTKEFAHFSGSDDRTTGALVINDEETKFRTYEQRQVKVNQLCFQQSGLYLTLHIRSFMELDFAALRTKTTYLAYSGEYNFIDSTFKYKSGILVSAEQDSHSPGTFESDEWGNGLNEFGIRNFTSYELGLRINITKNIAIGGKMGFSTESPFTSEHFHNRLFDFENDQQEGRFVSQINYVKAGITLCL